MPSASPVPMFIIKEVLPVMKTTGDLMKALSFPEISPEDYLSAHKEELLNSSPKELWTSLVERSGLRKAEIIRRSQFEAVYFYEVLAGKKYPPAIRCCVFCWDCRQSFPTVRKFYSYMDTDLYIPAFSDMSC